MEQPITALIVATDKSYGIGKNKSIPWKNKTDMDFFRDTTQNSICIMGRTTYESIKAYAPKRVGALLKNRISIVVSSTLKNNTPFLNMIILKGGIDLVNYNARYLDDGTFVVDCIDDAYVLASILRQELLDDEGNYNLRNIFFIGGASIYRDAVPYINKIYLNMLHEDYDCDTFFPKEILGDFCHEKSVYLSDILESNVYCKG